MLLLALLLRGRCRSGGPVLVVDGDVEEPIVAVGLLADVLAALRGFGDGPGVILNHGLRIPLRRNLALLHEDGRIAKRHESVWNRKFTAKKGL